MTREEHKKRLKLTDEDIPSYLKAKYPHMYQGNDEYWCRSREKQLKQALSDIDVELLLEAQLLKIFNDPHVVVKTAKVICLCGSTRFKQAFHQAYAELSDAGNIVLSVSRLDPQHEEINDVITRVWQEIHFRKIDLADEIFILNVGGYIGESLKKEIEYAIKIGKPIKYLEQAT